MNLFFILSLPTTSARYLCYLLLIINCHHWMVGIRKKVWAENSSNRVHIEGEVLQQCQTTHFKACSKWVVLLNSVLFYCTYYPFQSLSAIPRLWLCNMQCPIPRFCEKMTLVLLWGRSSCLGVFKIWMLCPSSFNRAVSQIC